MSASRSEVSCAIEATLEHENVCVYEVTVSVATDVVQKRWTVSHRYSEFKTLHDNLKANKSLDCGRFPGKSLLGSTNPTVVNSRKETLGKFLDHLLTQLSTLAALVSHKEFAEFLEVTTHINLGVASSSPYQTPRTAPVNTKSSSATGSRENSPPSDTPTTAAANLLAATNSRSILSSAARTVQGMGDGDVSEWSKGTTDPTDTPANTPAFSKEYLRTPSNSLADTSPLSMNSNDGRILFNPPVSTNSPPMTPLNTPVVTTLNSYPQHRVASHKQHPFTPSNTPVSPSEYLNASNPALAKASPPSTPANTPSEPRFFSSSKATSSPPRTPANTPYNEPSLFT
eukprot:TRINITY_DN7571_c0_g1_i1.p1 TRINITY_DN7571_c0_g1~~TRINITY_DN7571_c0_g1_i1.p1  ORF type:complete len:353 (+),score=72.04 TRINITY_DN7571_c0_g1_i1:35-1060(+)